MKEFMALVKREFISIRKEKTILLAVFVQLCIALLSASIIEGVMAFYDPGFVDMNTGNVKIGITGTGDYHVASYFREEGITVNEYAGFSPAEQAFLSGQIDAILTLPGTNETPVTMQLYLPKLESKKTAVLLVIDIPLKKYENYLRETYGISLNYTDLEGHPFSSYEFIYTVLIPLLMLFPALVAGSMVIDNIAEEYENKTIDTLLSSPVSAVQVFSSKVFVSVVTAVVQIGLWAGLLSWNNLSIDNPVQVIILAVSYALTISFGAACIALLFKDRQRSQFIYSMILIAFGAGSFFLSTSPVDLLTRLSSGAPNIGYTAYLVFMLLPVPLGLVFVRLSKRAK